MVAITRQAKRTLEIRHKALSLIKYVRAKDWRNEIVAVFRYVQNDIRYVRDIYGIETVANPVYTMTMGQGDCDDKCVLLASLLETIGHPCRFEAMAFTSNQFSHVVVNTRLGRGWLTLDATEDKEPGWRPPGVSARMLAHI